MNHELFREKQNIEQWLEDCCIENYHLIKDEYYGYTVNCKDVELSHKNIQHLRVKFNVCRGYFNVSHNELVSLKGSPKKVDKYFDCSHNKIKSLEYSPEIVKNLICNNNQLTHLKHCSALITVLDASYNSITNIEDIPKIDFLIRLSLKHNLIHSMKGLQINDCGVMDLSNNQLEDLEGFPNCISIILDGNKKLGEYQNLDIVKTYETIREEFNIKREKEKISTIIVDNFHDKKALKI